MDSNHIQGESIFYRDVQRNGLGTITATGTSDNVDLKFLIANKEQQAAFKEVLSAWYRSGVRVSESLNGHRTGILLLRSYHSYADMKGAKADLLSTGTLDH